MIVDFPTCLHGVDQHINVCIKHGYNEINFAVRKNTLDTLKYVRMLKEKISLLCLKRKKINTLTMDGELLLVVFSVVAQQEVENISANVKEGLKMKMQRGETVGVGIRLSRQR